MIAYFVLFLLNTFLNLLSIIIIFFYYIIKMFLASKMQLCTVKTESVWGPLAASSLYTHTELD